MSHQEPWSRRVEALLIPGVSRSRPSGGFGLLRARPFAVENGEEDEHRQDDHEYRERALAIGIGSVSGYSHHSSVGPGPVYIPVRPTVRGGRRFAVCSRVLVLRQTHGMPNCFMATSRFDDMDDIDPDTAMIAAGVVISLIALLELYPALRDSRKT